MSSLSLNDLIRLRRLPRALTGALAPVVAAAAQEGVRVALVGGIVRDRLLLPGVPLGHDIDVVVEGSAASLAARIGESVDGAAVRLHERFGTATVETPGGWRIDLAGSRRETYARPGALPEVHGATLEEDLGRRDFTVNAMAWELAAGASAPARLHDRFGGREDLRARRLRILHDESFEDDPTRALRAVRYGNRLGLRLEPTTHRRLTLALEAGAFETISGDRIRRELIRTLSEPRAAEALALASRLGVLAAIDPAWKWKPARGAVVRRAEVLAAKLPAVPASRLWMIPLLISTVDLARPARTRIADRLALTGESRRAFERFPVTRRRGEPASPDETVGEVEGVEEREERIASVALLPAGAQRRAAEGRLLRPPSPIVLSIRGADLVDAGIDPGRRIGLALAETARARGRGLIERRDELAFALAAARREV